MSFGLHAGQRHGLVFLAVDVNDHDSHASPDRDRLHRPSVRPAKDPVKEPRLFQRVPLLLNIGRARNIISPH